MSHFWDGRKGLVDQHNLLSRLQVLVLVPTTAVTVPRRGVEEEGC